MGFFTQQTDALLHDWLTSPTWHIDKPSENARFYRFAASLMQETGQPDLREVRWLLEEAAQEWGTEYDGRRDGKRITVLCERLQVLYDFLNAVQEITQPQELNPPAVVFPQSPSPGPMQPSPRKPSQETSLELGIPTSGLKTRDQQRTKKPPQKETPTKQNNPPPPALPLPVT